MRNKRLTLSLIAMISSVFLFVFASFAWLTISDVINIFGPEVALNNIDAEANLYLDVDGDGFVDIGSIELLAGVSGNTSNFQIVLENTGDVDITSKILLYGFTNDVADPLGDDTNFLAGKSLVDVIRISASNTVNSEVIDNQTLLSLLPSDMNGDFSESGVTLCYEINLAVGETATISFSFTIDGELAGNDYQNLLLLISKVSIQSVSQ
ncbi:MAG: hypothetical protein PHC62_06535 [Candidatus Izemoplasmatales bacterium]|nr:hypothetical protein [Candidatus Izemoplasmatales bacterium]